MLRQIPGTAVRMGAWPGSYPITSPTPDIAGKACPGAGPDPVLHRCHPMHRTVGISPGEGPGRYPITSPAPDIAGKACPGAGPDPVLLRRHPTHRTVGISPREGPGREPPPRRQKPYRPFPRSSRPGAGAFVVMAREGRNREAGPYTALLSPPPPGGDSAGDIAGKACPGAGPDPVLLRRHPMHRTVEISPGEGPGREPPPRRQKPYRPISRAPAQERALSW